MNSARNIYKHDVDFATLAFQSPEFAKHLKKNGQLDFSNPESVQQLTKSLLQRDFGIKLELPEDRLCPPVPNRFNYILWIQDLLDTTSDEYSDQYDCERDVIGLDIGTGASCIYPLLGCSQRPKWKFIATDVDQKNFEYAQENVNLNGLKSRIKVVQPVAQDPLIPLAGKIPIDQMDFIMCNPPFYESKDEMMASAKAKQRPPMSACTGAEIEMVTSGGEISFITRLLTESLTFRSRVQWYTTMLGKLSGVSVIVEQLKAAGITNWAVTEFVQGNRTRRWAVAWSWSDLRPRMEVARGIPGFPKHLMAFPSEFIFSIPGSSIDMLGLKIDAEMQALNFQWQWRIGTTTGLGFAMGNVWSRQARRKKQHQSPTNAQGEDDEIDEEEAALGIKIQLRQRKEAGSNVEIMVRWLKGSDAILFESFCGMLKRKLSQ